MITSEQQHHLNEMTDAWRVLGRVELHHKQGHASIDEVEAARDVCGETRRNFLMSVGLV